MSESSPALPTNSASATTSKIVKLNVGGRHFATTRTTLTSHPDSVLAKMFSDPNPAMLDEEGRYFIDRDGEVFKVILEYLRSHHLVDFGVSKQRIRLEAEFFGLDNLIQDLSHDTLPEPVQPAQNQLKKIFYIINGKILSRTVVSTYSCTYRGCHNGVSTVNRENRNLHFLHFWKNPKNNLGGQDRQ